LARVLAADYALLCYGGGGPLHVAGYTEGVATATYSSRVGGRLLRYGCACADFEYRYDQNDRHADPPAADEMVKAGSG